MVKGCGSSCGRLREQSLEVRLVAHVCLRTQLNFIEGLIKFIEGLIARKHCFLSHFRI